MIILIIKAINNYTYNNNINNNKYRIKLNFKKIFKIHKRNFHFKMIKFIQKIIINQIKILYKKTHKNKIYLLKYKIYNNN